MLDVLRFWLDRGVDGFRIDVAHMLMKDPDLRDNPPNPDPEPNPFELQDPEFYSQLHVYDRLHPDLHDVLRSINRVLGYLRRRPGRDWRDSGARVGPVGRVLRRGSSTSCTCPFAFQLIETPWRAVRPCRNDRLRSNRRSPTARGRYSRSVTTTGDGWRHGSDERRRGSPRCCCSRCAASPTILYGDELGHDGSGGSTGAPARLLRPQRRGQPRSDAYADAVDGRTQRRILHPPSPTTCGYPPAREYETINVESQLADPGSSLNLYRRLLALASRQRVSAPGRVPAARCHERAVSRLHPHNQE